MANEGASLGDLESRPAAGEPVGSGAALRDPFVYVCVHARVSVLEANVELWP